MPEEFERKLKKLEKETSNCRRWLTAIKAFFEESEKAYARYKQELIRLGRELKKADSLQTPESINHVLATSMRAQLCVGSMHGSSKKIVRGATADEVITLAAKKDIDEIPNLKDAWDKAKIYQIYSKLRLAYVELRKLITVANDINDSLNAEVGRLNEITKLADSAKKVIEEEKDEEARRKKHVEIVGKARQHNLDRYEWYEKKREAEKTEQEREEFRLTTHQRLGIAMKHFRVAMEVEEERLEPKEKEEYEEIARISTIEQNLGAAEVALHKAA
jgi:hypothetical protein